MPEETPKQFERIDLSRATFTDVDLRDARFQRVDLRGAVLRGVELVDAQIDGDLDGLVVNGVDVAPLISAELDRRYPDRPKMQPADASGFREAWTVLDRLWAGTVARARALPPALLHERVDGEWSFIQTLRHLAYATDTWVGRVMLGDPEPWHPLDLAFDALADGPGVPRDTDARPSLDEVLTLRADRTQTVRQVVADLTEEALAGHTEPVDGPGWPRAHTYPVRECLLTVLNEEWEHRLYAERDLDVLVSRNGPVIAEFSGEIWYWRGPSPYFFITVPDQDGHAIKDVAAGVTYGWGMVPATVRIGETEWTTSIFPKNGGYIVPIKDKVRRAEDVTDGDTVTVRLRVGPGH